jgi:TolB-like protein/DNA-binding winged helix-turn-helix (wHTH) protein/Flp pilus assembly protein TadD
MSAETQAGRPRIDLSRYELSLDGERVKLERQPMELLILFVQRQGQLVTREQIVEKLWGKDVFVDVDRSINAAVRKIRAALNDDSEHPRFLETVIGKGYRFTGEVELIGVAGSNEGQAEAESPGPGVRPSRPAYPGWTHTWPGILIGTLAVTLLAVAGGIWIRWRENTLPHPNAIRSIAVLPLANLSGDPSQDYFADGMTDELITELAKIGSLRVISRTSSVHYAGTKLPLSQVAKELRVDAIVEGSVVRSGNEVRITAQLIEASSDRHLWAESYKRDFQDVLAVQTDVARAIAKQVNTTFTPTQSNQPPEQAGVSSQAHEAYLRGLFFWNKWTEDGARKSIGYFEQAIQADPKYALAYAGLANSYIVMGDFGVGVLPPHEANSAAEQAALKALELDQTLAEAHAALAMSRFRSDGDLKGVDSEFKRALELSPVSATAHHWYSHYLLAVGRSEEAIAEGRRAYDLSPVDPEMGTHMQFLYLFLHRYDEVLEQGRQNLELDSNFGETYFMNGQAFERQHKYEDARREFSKALELSGRRSMILASFGHLLAVSGDRSAAQGMLDALNKLSEKRYVPAYEKALVQVGLGNNPAALEDLNTAYQEGSHWIFILQSDARLDPLRSDARFQRLLERVRLSGKK